FVLLAAFLTPLLAAFGLARIQDNVECGDASPLSKAPTCRRTPKLFNRLLFIGFILLALIGGNLFWAWRFPMPGDDVHATLLNGLSRAGFLLMTGTLLLYIKPGAPASLPAGGIAQILASKMPALPELRRMTPLLLLAIAWLDVLTHEPTQNPTTPPNIFEPNLARTRLAMNPQPELGKPSPARKAIS
ncbi:MAG: hypothetical protein ABSE90_09055, partial [Verrucomicrobiota bacterium]